MQAYSDFELLRKDYRLQSLNEGEVDANPVKQFEIWWGQAINTKIEEPNAMTLATATLEGKPSARIVLLKKITDDGFIFFTNYKSRKGKEIDENPFASITFFWKELERQVRAEGEVEKISDAESDEYFATRPFESRIGAWSSPQSSVILNREVLQKAVDSYSTKFNKQEIPRPKHWGGYILKPNLVEFWQGRPGRLHDRLQYKLTKDLNWKIERLAP
jgi:pyridoxamine 5'-phosphate oxidase